MIDHKAIFHYLNPEGCWHKGIGDGTLASCEKCGEFWTYTDREPSSTLQTDILNTVIALRRSAE